MDCRGGSCAGGRVLRRCPHPSIHFSASGPQENMYSEGEEGRRFDSAANPKLERLAVGLLRRLRRQFPANEPGSARLQSEASSGTDFLECQALFLRWLAAVDLGRGSTRAPD